MLLFFLLSVHPRGCGEHIQAIHDVSRINGSSPRVRGTHCSITWRIASVRFIPAGAGNTVALYSNDIATSVHPRGCGEHDLVVYAIKGSTRFIPAGAGNTKKRMEGLGDFPVHPRGCGEH